MKIKILLDTYHSALILASIASKFDENITITDNKGLRANAKSIMGTLSAMEYSELWLETEKEHYYDFKDFIAE
jgi:hypothetical protein